MSSTVPYSVEEIRQMPYLGRVLALHIRGKLPDAISYELSTIYPQHRLTSETIDEVISRTEAIKELPQICFPDILSKETDLFSYFTFDTK